MAGGDVPLVLTFLRYAWCAWFHRCLEQRMTVDLEPAGICTCGRIWTMGVDGDVRRADLAELR
jgi:hypothetical protein